MKTRKTKLADGSPETRAKIHLFTQAQKLYNPERKIKTLEDGILFAIEEAVKVPGLEAQIKELKEEIEALKKEVE